MVVVKLRLLVVQCYPAQFQSYSMRLTHGWIMLRGLKPRQGQTKMSTAAEKEWVEHVCVCVCVHSVPACCYCSILHKTAFSIRLLHYSWEWEVWKEDFSTTSSYEAIAFLEKDFVYLWCLYFCCSRYSVMFSKASTHFIMQRMSFCNEPVQG